MADQRYCVDYARLGTAGCKKCKVKIAKGSIRIAKVVSNPFSEEGGDMKHWYHVPCIFETFVRARATTKKIEDASDLEGWDVVKQEDRQDILQHIKDYEAKAGQKTPAKPKGPKAAAKTPPKAAGTNQQPRITDVVKTPTKKAEATKKQRSPSPDAVANVGAASSNGVVSKATTQQSDPNHRDNSFREFRRLCANVSEEPSYNSKTNIVSDFLSKGTSGNGFQGDLFLWLKMLLPGIVKRVYNLQNKQLVKLFSVIFGTNHDEMITDLEQGDVAETVKTFFEQSKKSPPTKKSTLTLFDVDEFLESLAKETKEEEQTNVLRKLSKRCTSNDLKMVVRLVKHDLRINAGAKHILEAVHPDAYQAFQANRNLRDVVDRILQQQRESVTANGKPGLTKNLSIRASLMTPVLPMLAEACKSVEYAFKKCPNGMYAEIKYDGERVQLHKKGDQFSYFSRSLKPVLPHKVQHFEEYIPKAFRHGNDVILDSEVLLIDTKTGNPLPFGTLGKHKRSAFNDANVCLFVFDCLHYNGENLMDKPLDERKRFLKKNMVEIKNRVMFSEMEHISQRDQLQSLIMKVLRQGLEGLVLKDLKSIYEPGKRHWLKVKKDYLAQGAMADSADLVVLGAFYGTGTKGGMMSIFLMGCLDPATNKWCTVTKVSGGHDDQTLDRLQKELDMVKISKDPSKVPSWLNVNKTLIPDFVCRDPKTSQVWEIVGAEFSKTEVHTACGISIRFPRVTHIRDDKSWKEATNLDELKELVKKSKESSDLPDFFGGAATTPTKKGPRGSGDDSESSGDRGRKKSKNGGESKATPPAKRKHGKAAETSDDEAASPAKKAKQRDLKAYFTPEKKTVKQNSRTSNEAEPPDVKQPLPDVFRGVKMFLSEDVPDYDELRRFLIAYDGDLMKDFEAASATHAVLSPDAKVKFSSSCARVTADWIWDCVKLQRLLPSRPYSSQ